MDSGTQGGEDAISWADPGRSPTYMLSRARDSSKQTRLATWVCIPLCAAELVELAAVGEDDERDLGVAEHGELVGLLEQSVPALGEGDLAVDLVLDPLQLDPPPPHG